MSPSPHLNPAPAPIDLAASPANNPTSSPNTPAQGSNTQLSLLLADAYGEIESLRRELTQTKRRAEKADRLVQSFNVVADPPTGANGSPQAIPESTARIIRDCEERVRQAELARDEAEARRRMMLDQWSQLESYLNTLEFRAQDARQGFSRVMKEGGGQLILSSIPLPSGPPGTLTHLTAMPPPSIPSSSRHQSRHTSSRSQGQQPFPSLPFPPPPNAHPNSGVRRPRTPSLDSAYPPSKRSRGNHEDQRGREPRVSYSESHLHPIDHHALDNAYMRQQPIQQGVRVIHAPEKYSAIRHSHSRSSSRSSASSMDVDEMLLRASTGDEHAAGTPNGAGASPNPHAPQSLSAPLQPQQSQHIQSSHRSRHRHGEVILDESSRSRASSRAIAMSESDALQYSSRRQLESPPYPASQSVPPRKGQDPGPHVQPGQMQTYQTHIFAPPVTGAPIKKSKFSSSTTNLASHGSSGVIGPIDAPPAAPAPPVPAYPPTNAQGQRICRQCGQAGRYKEGKCVEKWGPGPMGPGTVCDRCRKKMKRVERRGTLETQQQQQLANLASIAPTQQHQPRPSSNAQSTQSSQSSDRPIQRSDTILTQHLRSRGSVDMSPPIPILTVRRVAYREREQDKEREREDAHQQQQSHMRTIMHPPSPAKPAAGSSATRPASSPPPVLSLQDDPPTSNVGRGSRVPSRVQSRSGSRNASRTRETNGNGNASRSGISTKRSPLVAGSHSPHSGSPVDRMNIDNGTDSDADAEAEAEAEAEILGAVDATTSGGGPEEEEEGDAEADGDAEAELLEAVDAAEANSSSSHGGGGGGGAWPKAEDN